MNIEQILEQQNIGKKAPLVFDESRQALLPQTFVLLREFATHLCVARSQQALVTVERHSKHRSGVALQPVHRCPATPLDVEETHAHVLARCHCEQYSDVTELVSQNSFGINLKQRRSRIKSKLF